jgi:hypothetical protein
MVLRFCISPAPYPVPGFLPMAFTTHFDSCHEIARADPDLFDNPVPPYQNNPWPMQKWIKTGQQTPFFKDSLRADSCKYVNPDQNQTQQICTPHHKITTHYAKLKFCRFVF